MPNEQGPDRGDDPALAVYPTGPREELGGQWLLAVAREDAGGARRLPHAGEVEDQRRDVVDLVGPTMGHGEAREQRELIDTHSLKGLDELAADTRGHLAVAARTHIAPRTEERRNHAAVGRHTAEDARIAQVLDDRLGDRRRVVAERGQWQARQRDAQMQIAQAMQQAVE